MLLAPVRLPTGFLAKFGYHHGRRFVALFWEPLGDEACYNDGLNHSCGCCDNWLYLGFVRQPEVALWVAENGISLGCSEEAAAHWLVVDALTGDMCAAPMSEAWEIVRRQVLPDAL